MSTATSTSPTLTTSTLADAVLESLARLVSTPDGEVPPAAILWPDAEGQWKSLVALLRGRVPHLYELGTFSPDDHIGPAIWLVCAVARTLSDHSPPAGTVPILYLPGVARQELRAGADCPMLHQPLVELQYRGKVWHQRNGRDWTIEAFLTSKDALDLDVARDAASQQAMLRAIDRLADEPIAALTGRRLDVGFFESLSVSDIEREILAWMADADEYRKTKKADAAAFETFVGKMAREYGVDPTKQSPAEAAKCLARGETAWDPIWRRYADAPQAYPKMQVLMAAVPEQEFSIQCLDRSPRSNLQSESTLRSDLGKLLSLPHADTCAAVTKLDREHRERLDRPWTKLGESLLAEVLVPLAKLATAATSPLGGPDVATIARAYAKGGWDVDRQAMRALAVAQHSADAELVGQVVRAVYLPWLDKTAAHFLSVSQGGAAIASLVTAVQPEREQCLVFADGLRFDVAVSLQEKLEARGLVARLGHRIAPLPSVTATAKPAVMPLPASGYGSIVGGQMPETFLPQVRTAAGQKPATTNELHDVLSELRVAVLAADETSDAATAEKGGWTEVGRIDELGHKLGAELAGSLDEQVERIARRVADLLDAGWTRVRVVTDHGWLLVPGGLTKVEVPKSVVESKWSRAAAVKGSSQVTVPVVGWHWNDADRVATPPGAGAFRASEAYAHGGMSPQECVTPELIVERLRPAETTSITNIRWVGMRCRVSVGGGVSPLFVDLRTTDRDPASTVVGGLKPYDAKKDEAAMVVADDSLESKPAVVVVLNADGTVLDRMKTTIGGKT
ncbi:hypothetical protein LBMAG47_14240 [Planctomycetia bacterium]|nr:hypothetical protein LBMAG47_14240 [Planctomycetia bacterium]